MDSSNGNSKSQILSEQYNTTEAFLHELQNDSSSFDYTFDIISKKYCKTGIIIIFINSKKLIINDEKKAMNAEEFLEKYVQNESLDELNLICKKHNKKFIKYDKERNEYFCDEDGVFSSSYIDFNLDIKFKILLKNFFRDGQKIKNNELKNFYDLSAAICCTFREYPNLESYISTISVIKLILNDDKLFKYTESQTLEEFDREELKKKLIIIEIDLENKLDKKIIYSNCCKSSIEFNFIRKNKVLVNCFCNKRELSLKECLKFLQKGLKSQYKYKDLYCTEKGHNNCEFTLYCEDCVRNMCPNCNMDENHKRHKKEYFDKSELKIENFLELGEQFCKLINAIINTHNLYPNLKSLKSLKNAYKFLEEKNGDNNNIKGVKIQTFKELSKRGRTAEYFEKIVEILFEGKNIRSLRYFRKLYCLNNVQILKMKENCIISIKWLLNVNFLCSLKLLDLSSNKLGDWNIKFFEKLYENKKLENLEELYLHENIFKNLLMVQFLQFPKLKILYLGFNDFQKISEKELAKIKICDFSNLIEFGLNTAFLKNDINFLKHFTLGSLEILYLQNNDINSFSVLDNLNFKNLKEMHISNNLLKEIDIKSIKKFKKLEKVVADANYIEKIYNIEELKKFKELEIDFTYNNLNDETKNYLKSIKQNNLKINL